MPPQVIELTIHDNLEDLEDPPSSKEPSGCEEPSGGEELSSSKEPSGGKESSQQNWSQKLPPSILALNVENLVEATRRRYAEKEIYFKESDDEEKCSSPILITNRNPKHGKRDLQP